MTFFTQYGKNISTPKSKKNLSIPFKAHAQFPLLVDILSRKESHHATLHTDFPQDMNVYFLEALLHHLDQENIPAKLRDSELIYLDMSHLRLTNDAASIENDFHQMIKTLNASEKYVIFAICNFDLFSRNKDQEFLQQQFQLLTTQAKCRILFFTQQKVITDSSFTRIHLTNPSETDIKSILKLKRTELEEYHRILIPEDILEYTYSLTERYLNTNNTLEKALLLLDSGAARTAAMERNEKANAPKPVLSIFTLNNVVSTWTQIPAANLQIHKFKYSEFVYSMTQKVFGQDAVITLLGHELLQSEAHLQQHRSPFCSFLFTGPEHSGKHTTAISLTEQLFKQTNVLFYAQSTAQTSQSILDIKLQCHFDKRCLSMKELVQQIPYAVIMYENIERASPLILDQLQEILSTGYLQDTNGDIYNFRQIILILNTTLGSGLLNEIEKNLAPEREQSEMNLLQLVMLEQKPETFATRRHSPQEIADDVSAYVANHMPASLIQHLHVIPFLPLNKTALEKIILLKLKSLGKTLESRYGVELGYAPEVIHHLATESQAADIDKTLRQLYFAVDQAVLNQPGNKNRYNQLFLQLNDTGQLLRCDWIGRAEVEAAW